MNDHVHHHGRHLDSSTYDFTLSSDDELSTDTPRTHSSSTAVVGNSTRPRANALLPSTANRITSAYSDEVPSISSVMVDDEEDMSAFSDDGDDDVITVVVEQRGTNVGAEVKSRNAGVIQAYKQRKGSVPDDDDDTFDHHGTEQIELNEDTSIIRLAQQEKPSSHQPTLSEDLTRHTFDVDEVGNGSSGEIKLVQTRRLSRYVLIAQKAQKKRPRSQFERTTENSNATNLSTPGSRVTMHGERLSRVYINPRHSGVVGYTVQTSRGSGGTRGNAISIRMNRKYDVVVLGILPDELLVQLFSWMEPEDLGRISSVCRRWCSISEWDMLWESICSHYYPHETTLAETKRLDYQLEQSPKKSLLQRFKQRKSTSEAPVPFYKDVFVRAYTKDVILLKTGTWRNQIWKPKKSPWSKEDYLFMYNTGMKNRSGSVPIKVVVVGDGAVGKTSLLCRYANKFFPERDFLPTIFDNFSTQTIYQNQSFTVSLWDTAGPEDFDRLRPLSYIGADIFLLCVDLVNAHSLENSSQRWYDELTRHAPGIPILLCGTKIDLRIDKHYVAEARQKNALVDPISFDMGVEVAKKIGAVAYTETSALTGKGVEKTFESVMRYGCEFFLAQQKKRNNSCGIS